MPTTPYAGLVTRTIALLADAILINVLAAIAGAAIGLIGSLAGVGKPGLAAAVTGGVLWLGWTGLYFVAFWAVTGQTPGARLLGIRVEASAGRDLGVARASLRFVVMMLSLVPLGAGFLTVLFDDRRRGLPDIIADTVVVWASATLAPVLEPVELPHGLQVDEPSVPAPESPAEEPPPAPLGGLPDA